MAASGHTTWVTPARSSRFPEGSVADSVRWSKKMRCWFSGRHLSRWGTLGWTRRSLMPGTVACRAKARRIWPARPNAASGTRANASAGGGRLAPQHGRQREDQDRDEREAPDAEHRSALHQGKRIGERVAQRVPRKAAERVAARPFGRRQGQGEPENPVQATAPEAGGEPRGRAPIEREIGGEQGDGERQQRGERLGLDQECLSHPEEAWNEVAKPEPPADLRGGNWREPIPASWLLRALARSLAP